MLSVILLLIIVFGYQELTKQIKDLETEINLLDGKIIGMLKSSELYSVDKKNGSSRHTTNA